MDAMVPGFIRDLRLDDLPPSVVRQAGRCLRDLIAVAVGGSTTDLSRIVRDHAARHLRSESGGARMLFDGRRVSQLGAALAGGTTIDSLDGHDGHALTKGHAGVALLPALLAWADARHGISRRRLVTGLVVGYEVAIRSGLALHATAADYHSSGAWNAVGCAAVGAHLLGLDEARTRHALGIAEYQAPRGPMMRGIDHPTMLKDGSGHGAMVGVGATLLAAEGFTGAPAMTVEDADAGVRTLWADLGTRWRILEQYFKPYPVCAWSHPAIEAALALRRRHGLVPAAIRQVVVTTFPEAVRLGMRRPRTTEEAQYSLPFALAAALVQGGVGGAEVGADALSDPEILRVSGSVSLVESDSYAQRFPAERWAHVTVVGANGGRMTSEPTCARGGPDHPLGEGELVAKYRSATVPVLGTDRSVRIEAAVGDLADDDRAAAASLLDDLLEAVPDSSAPAPSSSTHRMHQREARPL